MYLVTSFLFFTNQKILTYTGTSSRDLVRDLGAQGIDFLSFSAPHAPRKFVIIYKIGLSSSF